MIRKRMTWLLPLLVTALVSRAQTDIPLTSNSGGTWTLASMPACNLKMVVEYDDFSVTVPTAVSGLTYTGEAQPLIKAGSSEDGTMVYSLDGETFSTAIPAATLPGTYTVYYKVTGDNVNSQAATLTSTITKAAFALTDNGDGTWTLSKMLPYNVKLVVEYEDFSVTAPTAVSGLTYTGEAQPLIKAGFSADGTMVYSLDGENFSTAIPAATLPGTYTVYYKVTGDNVNSQAATLTSTITKAAFALTNNGDGTWTLSKMLPYNVKLVVEYEDATGIEVPSAATSSDNDGTFYDLTGRKIGAKPTLPGIYVKNGKKVVVK